MTTLVLLFALTLPAQAPAAPSKSLVVSVGATARLQMASKRPITSVVVDREGVIRISPVRDDQTTVLVTGIAPGRVLITLTDDRGTVEKHSLR